VMLALWILIANLNYVIVNQHCAFHGLVEMDY